MPAPLFQCFSGEYVLERRPPARDLPLQAWDAADEYLLDTVAAEVLSEGRALVVNDTFGALAIGLHTLKPQSWGDSFTAHLALKDNLNRNHLLEGIRCLPATEPLPGGEIPTSAERLPYQLVLCRVPKSLFLFQQQIAWLQPWVNEDTLFLVGGMVKHLPEQAPEVLGQLGVVETFLARKKARVFRLRPQTGRAILSASTDSLLSIPEYDLTLESGPNVFAREKFDIGARFLLEQFDRLPKASRIADLGCGNGILGLVAQQRLPAAQVCFLDESYQAVAAAKANYARNGFDEEEGRAQFIVDDCLSHYAGEPFDLILCNPPFHQGYVVGDQTAWEMFVQSRRHLRPGGELWVVGNRHLNYHIKLKRIFGNYRQVAAHPKFVVLAARK